MPTLLMVLESVADTGGAPVLVGTHDLITSPGPREQEES